MGAGRPLKHGGYVEFLRLEETQRLDALVREFEPLLKAEGDYRPSDRLALESMLRALIFRERWEKLMDEDVAHAVDHYRKFDRDFRSWLAALGEKRVNRLKRRGHRTSPELERWLELIERAAREKK